MERKNMIIGIEGLVGSGKTSICRELLKRDQHAVLLNGGNLYRAIVYTLLQKEPHLIGLRKMTKKADIKKIMDDLQVEIRIEDRESKIYINGKLADEEELQSKASSLAVSVVGGIADNTKLFEFARNLIDDLKHQYNIIISGRALMDIYPNMDYHFFVTASLKERVKRKCIQYNVKNNPKAIERNIRLRDLFQKMAGFYKIHPNTIQVDVTQCDCVEQSTEKILQYLPKEYDYLSYHQERNVTK